MFDAALNPNTTPSDVLQAFSYPCLAPGKKGSKKNGEIFTFHLEFIINRISEDCVTGIWESIIVNNMFYSEDFYASEWAPVGVCSWLRIALRRGSRAKNSKNQLF